MKKSRTVARPTAGESPRHLPLVDLLVDARTELFELAVLSGLKVLDTMLEEDRTALCGSRDAHLADRLASRAGTVSSEVVLGGRKVAVRRPRVRAAGQEVPLPTFQAMADVDPLNRRVVEQMLVGVATRRYATHAKAARSVHGTAAPHAYTAARTTPVVVQHSPWALSSLLRCAEQLSGVGRVRALRRRNQRRLTWDRFNQWLAKSPLPRARIFCAREALSG